MTQSQSTGGIRFGQSTGASATPNVVHFIQKDSSSQWLMIGVLAVQFLLLSLVAWRMVSPPAEGPQTAGTPHSATVVTANAQAKYEALQTLIGQLLADSPDSISLADRLVDARWTVDRLESATDAQMAQISQLQRDLNEVKRAAQDLASINDQLASELKLLKTENAALLAAQNSAANGSATVRSMWITYGVPTGIGLGVVLIGVAAFWIRQRLVNAENISETENASKKRL